MQYQQNQTCCGSNASVGGWSYCGCGNQYPVVPGTNPALQTWNGQNFVVADGSAQNQIKLPFLQVNGGAATYVVGADNNGAWSYYNPNISPNLSGGAAGQVPWQISTNVTGFTATGTNGQLLQSGGTGSPTWITPNNLLVTATGSTTARTLANRFADVVNVLDFGAVGNGIADDTAAIQSAINYAQSSNIKSVYFPAGTYFVSSTINITSSLTVFGDGRFNTYITWNNATLGVFNVNSFWGITVDNIGFKTNQTPTSGYVFQISNGISGMNNFSVFRNLYFEYSWIAIKTVSAETLSIDTCYFYGHQFAGVVIQNINTPDAGDSTIVDCVFSGAGSNASGIVQYSSGGLKILGTKILGGLGGYHQILGSEGSTSDLVIVGNSIEGQTNFAILLERASNSNVFSNVLISSNQIALVSNPNTSGIVLSNNSTQYLDNVNISSNIITIGIGTSYGIVLGAVIGGVVNSNYIRGGIEYGASNSIGISITSNSVNTALSGNVFYNCTTNITTLNQTFLGQQFLLAQSSTPFNIPANTNENILASVEIPAYTLGINGLITITGTLLCTNNSNVKTLRVRFGDGTLNNTTCPVVFQGSLASSSYTQFNCQIGNSGSTGNQSIVSNYIKDTTPSGISATTSNIDTTINKYVVITGQKTTAGDTLEVLNYNFQITQS